MNNTGRICLLMSIIFVSGKLVNADTIYVNSGATGGNNGTSWSNAYVNLQSALTEASSGHEIWVAAGTYYPSIRVEGHEDREKAFQMINGVGIYGGFNGTETTLDQRDVQNNQTILSGNIGNPEYVYDNCYHVFNHPAGTNLEESAILDGFTISDGNQEYSDIDGIEHPYGGGMFNVQSSPTVTNCTFRNNFADYDGGGMCNWSGNPAVINCIFTGNTTNGEGGGMLNEQSSPTVTNCTFNGNSAYYGGGMSNSSSNPTVTNCILWDNTASSGNEIYGTATVSYSCVQGDHAGVSNIDADPLFVDAPGGDYHLQPVSPCIDVGDPSGNYTGKLDMDGESRMLYDNVDMGADEVFPIAGDIDMDGDIDLVDFAFFADNWLKGTH